MITAEYLPSKLNVKADLEPRSAKDSSNWKLHQKIYSEHNQIIWVSKNRSVCVQDVSPAFSILAWKPDPNSIATDSIQ